MAKAATPLRPGGDPLTLDPEAVRETHCSRVLLQGDMAYKIRKPVRFAFLDQGTTAARRALAEAEVRLNQELAPGTYLGVVDVRTPDGIEPAVAMRRFREADTLAARLATDAVAPRDLAALGRRLAAFHAAAPRAEGGGAVATLARAHRNMEELLGLVGPELDLATLSRTARGLEAAVLRHADALDARARAGRWREGHGDLRADHVVLEHDAVHVVDRLEFDRELRCDDVGADLAFLLMDLEARGGRAAAQAVLDAYRGVGGDPGDDDLLAVWGAYRATVAAKVALLWAAQTRDLTVVARARARMALAGTLLWRARAPLAVVVCGPPASGKSTLAAEIARRSGFPVVSSDVVRKARAGIAAQERAPREAYSTAMTMDVYRELGAQARQAVAGGDRGVIIDATMRSPAVRDALRETLGDAPTVWVECQVPAAVADARATTRAATGRSVSDADAVITARMRAAWRPLDDVPAAQHVALRTDRDPAAAADALEAHLDTR